MAQFFDGFEQFRTLDKETPAAYMKMAGYSTRGVLTTGQGRIGRSICLFTLASAFERKWAWSGDTITVGFACMQQKRGALFGFKVGDETGRDVPSTTIYTDPQTGLVTIRNQNGDLDIGYVTPLPKRWYYYEISANRNTGVVTVQVNGKDDVAFTLDADVKAASEITLVFNPFDMLPSFPAEANYEEDTKQYDDMYVQDGGRLGPIQISGRLPSGDVAIGWNVSDEDPAYPHNRMVGVLPPDPSNRFIFTGVNDVYDAFNSSDALPDNGAIIAQGLVTLVRKATSDPVSVIANIDGNTVTMSNIGRQWEYRYTLLSPAGYDKTSIEAAIFGVRSVI